MSVLIRMLNYIVEDKAEYKICGKNIFPPALSLVGII